MEKVIVEKDLKFDDFEYQRPLMDQFSAQFNQLIHSFEKATSFEEQNEFFEQINHKRKEFSSMNNICSIRHTVDTKDTFYEEENNFFDTNNPLYTELVNNFYRVLIKSTFRKELEKKWGNQLFVIAELSLKTFESSILEDLKEENKLSSEYVKLKAGATITFRGKQYNLASLAPFEQSEDRLTRKEATEAKWAFYEKHAEQFENIFDQQVKVRNRIAQKLGYKNFIALGYARMLRSDYTPEMVANYRDQIKKYIVPIASELYERQAKRLGFEQLKYYDLGFRFPSGNPKPKGNPEWIVDNASKMYAELSKETDEFFTFMRKNNLMDLVNREGKATGGYCTYIDKYKACLLYTSPSPRD